MVEKESQVAFVRIPVQMIYTVGIEERRPALDAMDYITLAEEQLGKLRAILPGDACDERSLRSLTNTRSLLRHHTSLLRT